MPSAHRKDKEEVMKNATMIVLVLMIGFALMLAIGCVPTKVWIGSPTIQTAGNQYYVTQLEPLTMGHKFFVSFRLTVTNKTDKNLEIDWNKTRYVHNGRTRGVFVFKGIIPKDIKNLTIPSDTIPAENTYSKVISPYECLARAPIRDSSKGISKPGISAGIIPTGENGILLVVRQKGEEVVEKLTSNIQEKEVQ